MTGTLRLVGHLGVVLVTLIQQLALLYVDRLNHAQLLGFLVVTPQCLHFGLLLGFYEPLVVLFRFIDIFSLLLLELVGLLLQLFIAQNNVVELWELVLVGFPHFIHEPLVDAHFVDLGFDLLGLELVLLEFEGCLLDSAVELGDLLIFGFLEFDVLLLPVLLNLKVI